MPRTLKDSGVPWIGQIPVDWQTAPIRALFQEVTTKNILGKEKEALQFRYGTIVKKSNFDFETDEYVQRTMRNYTCIYPGVIVINGLNLNYDFVTKRVALSRLKGAITSAYITIAPINAKTIWPQFAEYLLKSYDAKKAFHGMGDGVRKILNFTELKHQPIIYPAYNEQKKIADFLDKKCGEVDALAHNIQQQIDTLEQYKWAIITETVTKGLNPSAPMKDSGVPWIGQIPGNWYVHRAKFHFQHHKYIAGIKASNYDRLALTMQGVIKRSKEDNEGLQPLDFTSYQVLKKDELVFKLIDLQNISTSRVGLSPFTGVVSPAYIILHAQKDTLPRYAMYFFLFMWLDNIFNSLGDAGVRSSLNASDLLNLPFILPSLAEQKKIADFLDDKCGKIDSLIKTKQEQLAKLEEYKKAIIFEYVTGKKPVPEEER